ncbi:hypothetical protein [Pygmaiobacter massiliensis]|uniref:hypothetical protein n=1 Tax=Pygmaiobacter massiliensis TaxID=1917873 RepID=UPI000C7D778B|nr:hypothetical protein [Pygmaiobacter massiliensis]
MRNEFSMYRSQLKGYLFEVIINELLRKNGFTLIAFATEPQERVRKNREGFIEIRGRGCWHQIDCPCDFNRLIPFSYPLRLLGEVKFYRSPLAKKHIREYIGVVKDIQENYFVADGVSPEEAYPRKAEVGVYFSASGFQAEAEKLAYAHGIKTISYANNYLIDQIKNTLVEFESNYLSVNCIKAGHWNDFQRTFISAIRNQNFDQNIFAQYCADGYHEILSQLQNELVIIKSSFIATTATGVFLHFVGNRPFPEDEFAASDEGRCRVYFTRNYNNVNGGQRLFWMEINDDHRRFYFTPPESLDYASVFGGEIALDEKERLFGLLNVNIVLGGITRNLILHLDRNWLDAIRE